MKALPEIVSIKEKAEQELLKRPGVTGVDVGYKYVGGKPTDEVAIRVHVSKKKKNLPHAEMIPAEIEGVPTDVIERTFELHAFTARKKEDEITLMADTGKYSTLKGGIGIGPCRAIGGYVYVGTLGAIVKDNATNQPMMLSNFHVMCVDTGWHVGDTMAQPSRVDGGSCPTDVVGTLQRSALTNKVDGAVALITARPHVCEVHEIGAVTGTGTATLGSAVRKRGRTTGLTYGIVDSISLTVTVDYGPGLGNKTLTNQIGIRADTTHNPKFGDHGDSGSVVVDSAGKVLGLYFAGDATGYGVANQISDVLSALNVTLCTGSTKSVVKDALDHKQLKKEIYKELVKEHKLEQKEHKLEKIEVKEHKLEKLELKEHQKSEFEVPKLIEVPGQIPQVPDRPQLPNQPQVPAASGAGSVPSAQTPLKKLEIKEVSKDKNEIKDFKREWKEKHEIKDFKDHKIEKLERKEHGKPEFDKPYDLPPGGEIPGGPVQGQAAMAAAAGSGAKLTDIAKVSDFSIKPLKDFKDHKIEWKEFKHEAKEIKEAKDRVDILTVPNWPPIPDPGPLNPGLPGVGQLSPFISADLRPDLAAGALRQEPDLQGTDFTALSQQLQKEAADAMQAKTAFDNAQTGC